MKPHMISTVTLLTLVLASCKPFLAADGQSPGVSQNDSQSQESLSLTSVSNSSGNAIKLTNTPEATDKMPTSPDMDKFVNLAKKDLAGRLKIDIGQIALLKTKEITWPDISMGCSPSPGQILPQGGQVYGYRVWLEATGEEYIYHIGLTGQIILCPKLNPGANNPLLMTPDSSNQDPQNQAP